MPSRFILQQAAKCFTQGGILAYPTEAVYGLGCDPLNLTAVMQLLQLKNRPMNKGLILLSDNINTLLPFIKVSHQQAQQISQSIATTWLVNASHLTPAWVKGQHPKVAVRVSHHLGVKKLCKQFNTPIISTSANPANRPAAKTMLQLQKYFHQQIDFIVPGNLGSQKRPSRIIDIDSQQVLRY